MSIFTRLGAMFVVLVMVLSLAMVPAGTANAAGPKNGKVTIFGALPAGCKAKAESLVEKKSRDKGVFTVGVVCKNPEVISVSVTKGQSRRCLIPLSGTFNGCPANRWSHWSQARVNDILVPQRARGVQALKVQYEFPTVPLNYLYQGRATGIVTLKNGTTVRTKVAPVVSGSIDNNPRKLHD